MVIQLPQPAATDQVPPYRSSSGPEEKGFSLLELLLAMLLLGMISAMIYSVLNVGIRFSAKGEKKILALEQQHSVLTLLHQQITSAWYSQVQKKVMVSTDNDIFKVVTRQPLINRSAAVVLALYRYNAEEKTIYYAEKKDFFNIDYGEDYIPEFDDMIPLLKTDAPFSLSYDHETGPGVQVEVFNKNYEFIPRCQQDMKIENQP